MTGAYWGDKLWGHDKGLAIPHLPPPPVATPSIGMLLLGSSTKHYMPSYGVQEKTTLLGAIHIGSSGPIAISTPACFMTVQQCQDAGVGFVWPTGVVFCMLTTRLVGFSWADVAAGFLGMLGNAAAIGSKLGAEQVQIWLAVSPLARHNVSLEWQSIALGILWVILLLEQFYGILTTIFKMYKAHPKVHRIEIRALLPHHQVWVQLLAKW